MRRLTLTILFALVSLFAVTSAAQAVVLDMGAAGHFGVALVPAQRVNSSASGTCSDPWLSSDLGPALPNDGLCYHGGSVLHSNETFAFTWDPVRSYWQTTRNYVEQFLGDVANGSGTLTSPYAVTGQYRDSAGAAANKSLYGGGCIDYGGAGGSACKFGATNGSGAGHDYPANGCTPTGTSVNGVNSSGDLNVVANDRCLTDAQLKGEVATMISQTGLAGHTGKGYTPLVVLLTPPGVETCLDGPTATACSVNSDLQSPGHPGSTVTRQFCSYHSHVNVNGTEFAYVVQPWTAYHGPAAYRDPLQNLLPGPGCDEPEAPVLPRDPPPQDFAINAGLRLVSALSQGQLAAITNPGLNGWFALNGTEINDNTCWAHDDRLDTATVGNSSQNPYLLQREFNNAGVIETDPNAPPCASGVALAPTFVVPGDVNQGDVVQFDGSTSISSLIVPNAGYVWSFGDGTPDAKGPSVVHTYAKAGTYAVGLTVTDRGGDVRSLSQTIVVLGPAGSPPPNTHPTPGLHVHVQLLPQGLRAMLHAGVSTRVTSNERAAGFVTLSISRRAARRAHIKTGRGSSVVIGRGTVSGIAAGTVHLHLRLSRTVATKLRRLGHVALTIRLALVAAGGDHLSIVAAGRY